MASSYESSVNVAVFQSTCSFTEGQVLNLNVGIFNAISFHDLTSVSFGTGASSAYSNAFAFEISNGFDARFFQGYDLYGFGIQGSQALQVSNLFILEHFGAVSSIVSNIVLDESDFYFALLQQVYVSYGSAGGLSRSVSAFDILVQDISQSAAQREIGTGGTAGSNVNEFLCSWFLFVLLIATTTSDHSSHNHHAK